MYGLVTRSFLVHEAEVPGLGGAAKCRFESLEIHDGRIRWPGGVSFCPHCGDKLLANMDEYISIPWKK